VSEDNDQAGDWYSRAVADLRRIAVPGYSPFFSREPDASRRRRDGYRFSSIVSVTADAAPGELSFGPFRYEAMQAMAQAELSRLAEERDCREWIEGIRRRLGLVTEVHRCHVFRGNPEWIWSCLRDGCYAAGYFCLSQADAFAGALAHARAFVPGPPEEIPVTELDLLAFDALWAGMRAEQDAFAAVLPRRMEAVADVINEYLAGVLPDGMRFEWVADGE
jgi:hypothetical protein